MSIPLIPEPYATVVRMAVGGGWYRELPFAKVRHRLDMERLGFTPNRLLEKSDTRESTNTNGGES